MPAMLGIVWRISSKTADTGSSRHVQAHAPGDLLDDPQVLPRVAGRIERLAAELHQPVGVGEGAGLLRERARRQDDVGEVAGLGEEDVLHDQVLEHRQRFARVVGVGVGHRRVLAHDVHAAHAAGLDRRASPRPPSAPAARRACRSAIPTRSRSARARRGSTRTGSRGTSSGSGPHRTRPARCSGRAADAGPCRGGRSGPS